MPESNTPLALQKKFEYEALDLTKQQIRLLTLHPALSEQDTIECSLEIFDTDNCPRYVALSYMWGLPSPAQSISVDQQSFTVRQNLYDFLLAYRNDSNNTHYIWIDQICISQAHTGERNHQVRLMSVIYTNSLWTLSWLGIENQKIASQYASIKHLNLMKFALALDFFRGVRGEYFRRLWIVQELLLAPAVRVLCGNVWLEFEELMSLMEYYGGTYYNLPYACNGLLKAVSRCSRAFSLIDAIELFSCHKSEDSRDKIYGLMGLVRQKLIVDYNKTTSGVFVDLVLALATSGTLIDHRVNGEEGGFRESWDILRCLLYNMGLVKHEDAFRDLWYDLRDNHIQANPTHWIDRDIVPAPWRGRRKKWRLSSESADTAVKDFDD